MYVEKINKSEAWDVDNYWAINESDKSVIKVINIRRHERVIIKDEENVYSLNLKQERIRKERKKFTK